MGNITTMMVFVWTLNILIFMAQATMLSMNPESVIFYNTTGTVLAQHSQDNNIAMPNSAAIARELNPNTAESAQESTSIIPFVDAISSIKSWIQDKINYLTAIVLGPYNILNAIPLPASFKPFIGAIALLWYGVSVMLIIAFIFGRPD